MREDAYFLNSPTSYLFTMPFTVSHTIAVIPLVKYLGKYGALSALIIGSMTPDIAYLTPALVHQRVDSHTLIGIFMFCIPMGLTVYFLYHWLMAPVICSILPKSIQKHLSSDLLMGRIPNTPAHVIVLSLVIGALTHIVWDFFTHQSGIPQFVSWMDTPLTTIDNYDIMPYRVLQHFSTLFGLSLLMFWMWGWYQRHNKNTHNTSSPEQPIWRASKSLIIFSLFALTLIPVLVGSIYGYAHLPETTVLHGFYGAQVAIRHAIVAGAAAFLVTSFSLGLLYQLRIYQSYKQLSKS